MSRPTILISGAGIAGTTLAYWLLKRGFTPVLIERAPRFRAGGYMIDFWGMGFDVAERMGLIPALRNAGYRIDRVEFVAGDGRLRSTIGGNAFQRTLGDRFFSLPRGDLAEAIYRALGTGVETIFGDSVAAMEQGADGVEVSLARGGLRTFDLVVGALGAACSREFGQLCSGRERNSKLPGILCGFICYSRLSAARRTRLRELCGAPGRQMSRYALREDLSAFLFVFPAMSGWQVLLAIQERRGRSCKGSFRVSHGLSGLRLRDTSRVARISISIPWVRDSQRLAGLMAAPCL